MASLASVVDKLPIAVTMISNGSAINAITTAVDFNNPLIKNIGFNLSVSSNIRLISATSCYRH